MFFLVTVHLVVLLTVVLWRHREHRLQKPCCWDHEVSNLKTLGVPVLIQRTCLNTEMCHLFVCLWPSSSHRKAFSAQRIVIDRYGRRAHIFQLWRVCFRDHGRIRRALSRELSDPRTRPWSESPKSVSVRERGRSKSLRRFA